MNARIEEQKEGHSNADVQSQGQNSLRDYGAVSRLNRKWDKRLYQVGERFGRSGYRTNIVRVEKLTLFGWLIASVAGRLLCLLWAVALVAGHASVVFASWRVVVPGVALWVFGEFFVQAANRGILYHHMDFLAEWLERRKVGDEHSGMNKSQEG